MRVCVNGRRVTHRYEKLFDLLQSVTHPGVSLSWRREHLDEDVQVFAQVVILGLAALPELLFLSGTRREGRRREERRGGKKWKSMTRTSGE